jgi:hypothetical protein
MNQYSHRVEQERIAKIESDKKKKELERICNAMELRDIKICIFQISLAVLVISSKSSFF